MEWFISIVGLLLTGLFVNWAWRLSLRSPNPQTSLMSDAFFWDVDRPERWESGDSVFHVQRAKQLIVAFPREVISLEVAPIFSDGESRRIHLREQDLSDPRIDLQFPVILAMGENALLLIDGWHRIAKARQMKVQEVNAVILTREETKLIEEKPRNQQSR